MDYPPTVTDFKTRFDRDFVFGDGLDSVRDVDITNAIADAAPMVNQGLWSSTAEATTAYLLASAHYLVLNLQASGGPMARKVGAGANNRGGGVILSKNVGSIGLTYSIPESVQNSRILGPFMRTDYGQRYLQMIAPRLVGNVAVAGGFVESDVDVNDASQT